MSIARWAWVAALVLVAPAGASAQSASAEVVVTTPATPVPPPPAVAAPAPSTGVYVAPSSSPYVAPSSGVYVAPTGGVYAPEAVPRTRRVIDWGLVGSGIGLFAGGWLATWITTAVWYDRTTHCTSTGWWSYSCTHEGGPGGEGLAWSFLPVLGPWLMLTDPYLDTPGEIAFPIIAGLVQDVGLVLMIVGLATMHDEMVMEEVRRAGDVRFSANASPSSAYAGLDVVF